MNILGWDNIISHIFKDFKINLGTALLASIVAVITFSASHVEKEIMYLSTKSLNIYMNMNSPAYAALEDMQNTWLEVENIDSNENFEQRPLKWGEDKNLWVLQNTHLLKYTNNAQKLNAISISSTDIMKKNKLEPLNQKIMIPPEEIAAVSKGITISSTDTHPERVTVAQNLLQATLTNKGNKQELDEVLDEIIEEEKSKVYQGPKIIAGSPLRSPNIQSLVPEVKKEQREIREKKEKSYLIRGNIEFSGGVAFTGLSDQIRLARIEENLILDEGHVNLQDANFEITVKELYGYIVAELTGADEQVIGYAEIDLAKLNYSEISAQDIIINKNIKIKPYKEGFNVKAISGASFMGHTVEILKSDMDTRPNTSEKVKLSIDGLSNQLELNDKNRITSDMFTKDSNLLMRLEAKNHWGSLAIGFGETNQKMRLYKNTLVEALISDYKESHDGYAVIWGRVVDENGKPIAGAKVELAGDLAKGPFYFNKAHLVDYSYKETKEDGLFAFVKVLPGLHAIRATVRDRELPVDLMVADAGHVSYIEVKKSSPKHITLKSYNPLSKLEVDTSIKIHGSEKIYDIYSGERNLEKWPGVEGLSIIESDPGEGYELSRQLINRKNNHHNVPVVKSAWLNKIMSQKRLNKDSTKGIIIGFVQGDGFEVFPGRELNGWSQSDIEYFDEKGRVLPKKIGQAGGGFIMYNVPESVTSISIIPKKSEKIFTQLAISDRYYISVMSTNFLNQK